MQADAHYIWSLNAAILFLYVSAAAIFVLVMNSNIKAAEGITNRYQAGGVRVLGAVALMALASNFIASATVALLARLASAASRQSMVLVPLLLLGERHLRAVARSPRERGAHVWGLAGGAAGMLAGAGLFLSSDFVQDTVARVELPGTVQTLSLEQVVRDPSDWAISIQLVVFYCVSLAIFFAAHHVLERTRAQRPPALGTRDAAVAGLSALALNFLGAALLVLLARGAGVEARKAMVLFPLLLVIESYVDRMRADAAGPRSYWPGLAGSVVGMAASVVLLLRGAPLH